jgi:protein involved in polysaccharide export with SLBB domain
MKIHLLAASVAIALLGAISPARAQSSFIPEAPALNHSAPTPLPVTPMQQPDATPDAAPAPMVAASISSMDALDNTSKLRIGDTISFRIIEDRDSPVTRPVEDSGEIEFPYVGRVKVEGKTCKEIAEQLKKILEVHYYNHATVIIGIDHMANQMTPHDYVWLIGETRQVGPQQISPSQPLTLSQVILKAGGFGPYADERHVHLVHNEPLTPSEARGKSAPPVVDPKDGSVKSSDVDSSKVKRTELIYDVKSVLDGKSTTDPVVQPGDYIITKKRFINF